MAMKFLRASGRLVRVLGHALHGWWTIRRHFGRMSQPEREAAVQQWAQAMLARMGITLEVQGAESVQGPVLLVANHISWLDILVMHASRYCRFVSKDDVRDWPLVGPLATGAGTLYIERGSRRDAQRVVHAMADALQQGQVVAVFPEGTTSDGTQVLPFHANLLQSVVATGVPVRPVALAYVDRGTGRPSPAPIYVGDDSLAASVWRTLSETGLCAVVRYGEAETAQGRDRRSLANDLRDRIVDMTGARR